MAFIVTFDHKKNIPIKIEAYANIPDLPDSVSQKQKQKITKQNLALLFGSASLSFNNVEQSARDNIPQSSHYFSSPESDLLNANVPPDKPVASVFRKKYKPVVLKVRPIISTLPQEYHITHNIIGDPLQNMPELKTK